MAISELNKEKLSEFSHLKADWFDLGKGELISDLSIDLATKLLDLLPEDFEVFPLVNGFIQVECERGSKYIEVGIYDYQFNVYWQNMYNENRAPDEGEDIFWYDEGNVFKRLPKFINYFLEEM